MPASAALDGTLTDTGMPDTRYKLHDHCKLNFAYKPVPIPLGAKQVKEESEVHKADTHPKQILVHPNIPTLN